MGSLIHMIVTKSKNKDIRWCTKKYYSDEKRVNKYNQLANFIVSDNRLHEVRETLCQVKRSHLEVMDYSILHNWCSNTRRKIKAGIWTDDSDYVPTKIYYAHQEYLQNLGYTIKSD